MICTTRSLEAVQAGEMVAVETVLFEDLRDHLHAQGVSAGVSVRVVERTPTHLLLDPAGGGTVALQRHWARFIEVAG